MSCNVCYMSFVPFSILISYSLGHQFDYDTTITETASPLFSVLGIDLIDSLQMHALQDVVKAGYVRYIECCLVMLINVRSLHSSFSSFSLAANRMQSTYSLPPTCHSLIYADLSFLACLLYNSNSGRSNAFLCFCLTIDSLNHSNFKIQHRYM